MHSEKVDILIAALVKAQMAMEAPKKDSINPHFKSRYADLAADWEACRKPLTENGLAVVQTTVVQEQQMVLRTWLFHSSGQWIYGDYLLHPQKNDPQGMKSCVTYARRAALEAMVGLAPEDDDGNAATSRRPSPPPRQVPQPTQPPQLESAQAPKAYSIERPNYPGWDTELATEPQRRKLWAMAKEAGYDEAHLKEVMVTITRKDSTKDLTKGEIQILFKEFEALKKQA